MKLRASLLVALLLQVALVHSQASPSSPRYNRRKGNLRRNNSPAPSSSSSSTSLLPDFLTRAFGGGGSDDSDEGAGGSKRAAARGPGGGRRAGPSSKPRSQQTGGRRQRKRPGAAATFTVTSMADLPTYPHPALGGVGPVPFAAPGGRGGPFAGGAGLPPFMHPGAGPFAAAGTVPRRRVLRGNGTRGGGLATVVPLQPAGVVLSAAAANSRLATPPQSLEGWLSYPTESPVSTTTKFTPTTVFTKSGVCGDTLSYGIKCRERMDQCTTDIHCPGGTKCCMVGDCGYLCVKPKASSEAPKKKQWGGASNVLKRQREQELLLEISTTSAGLKLDDITEQEDKEE